MARSDFLSPKFSFSFPSASIYQTPAAPSTGAIPIPFPRRRAARGLLRRRRRRGARAGRRARARAHAKHGRAATEHGHGTDAAVEHGPDPAPGVRRRSGRGCGRAPARRARKQVGFAVAPEAGGPVARVAGFGRPQVGFAPRAPSPSAAAAPAPPSGQCHVGTKLLVAIKHSREINLQHLRMLLARCPTDIPAQALQVLDIVLRDVVLNECKNMEYVVVGRSFFSRKLGCTKDSRLGIEEWKGFYQSIRPTQNGLCLIVVRSEMQIGCLDG